MIVQKLFIMAMSFAVLICTLPDAVWADGDRGTKVEEQSFAQREAMAEANGTANFVGGRGGGPFELLGIVVYPVIYLIALVGGAIIACIIDQFSGDRDVRPARITGNTPHSGERRSRETAVRLH